VAIIAASKREDSLAASPGGVLQQAFGQTKVIACIPLGSTTGAVLLILGLPVHSVSKVPFSNFGH
jgi:hypothetical protein